MGMTEREFLNKVVAGEMTDEVKAYAENGIAKLNARNDKRKNTKSKAQIENEGIMATILETLATAPMVASEIATALGISTQKASALCKLLANEGKVTVTEVKVKNKGAVKQYALAPTEDEVAED